MIDIAKELSCYHCGEPCATQKIKVNEKSFCCNGCKSVFLLLHQHEMEDYYCLNEQPGIKVVNVAPEKFAFLDDEKMAQSILSFANETQASVTLYLPQIHCSSCLWLLEHLDRIDKGIISSRVNFQNKEICINYNKQQLTLRQVAQMLAGIGYEPHITINESKDKTTKLGQYSFRKAAYKLGVTGFCFANIMLISFPEYLGMDSTESPRLINFFRGVNLLLAFPVLLYGAREFFENALYSFKQRYINIDAPIALAISVTFGRSVFEIVSQTGGGYLDSMSGIVFFMLLGRTLQNRSYSTLSFNRDYKSYFPISITVVKNGAENITPIQEIKEQDILWLHHQEVVPTDCILSKGKARIDYSFITGESQPQIIQPGELIYAGGKITGAAIEVIAVKDFAQNSFTQLWNNQTFKQQESDRTATTTLISKYFSAVVVLIALGSFCYWQFTDAVQSWNALTAVLIVACPCALLLNATFTNGYLMEFFARQGLFLKNAQVIERMAKTQHIAFDKTGTITEASSSNLIIKKMLLNEEELSVLVSLTAQSVHPLSRGIYSHYRNINPVSCHSFKELPGKGIEAWINDKHFKIGSHSFVAATINIEDTNEVYVSVDGVIKAQYIFPNKVKRGVRELLRKLKDFRLSLVSGDNSTSAASMRELFPAGAELHYLQSPEDKLQHIKSLQEQGKNVMMVGDGLNDAGALKQSDTGIAIVAQSFSFSPACDAILEAGKIAWLPEFIQCTQAAQRIILIGFGYSILFNLIGIAFAITGNMSPMIAAILMPSSSLGIILISFLGIRLSTKKLSSTTN